MNAPAVIRRAAGFSLLEVAIVMVIVGMLTAATLIPLSAQFRAEHYVEERERMKMIKDAIAGYALRNRTTERRLFGGEVVVPAGLPYLPCPDITHDGLEDRLAPGLSGRAALYHDPGPNPNIVAPPASADAYFDGDSDYSGLDGLSNNDHGACSSFRGLLPHRTLNVPPTDRWGNRYGYAVDSAFTNGVFGFDSDTRADAFYPGRAVTTLNAVQFERRLPPSARYSQPLLVCDGEKMEREGVDICRCNLVTRCLNTNTYTPLANVLAVGRVATINVTGRSPRPYQRGDVIEGAMFVLWSAGPNGHGAIGISFDGLRPNNYYTNINSYGAGIGSTADCKFPMGDTSNDDFTDSANPGMYAFRHEAVNFQFRVGARYPQLNFPQFSDEDCYAPLLSPNTFVTMPRVTREETQGGADVVFDDIVLWMETTEFRNLYSPREKSPLLVDR